MLVGTMSVKFAVAMSAMHVRLVFMNVLVAPRTPAIFVSRTRPLDTMRQIMRLVEVGPAVLAPDSDALGHFAVAVSALDWTWPNSSC